MLTKYISIEVYYVESNLDNSFGFWKFDILLDYALLISIIYSITIKFAYSSMLSEFLSFYQINT